MFHQQAHKVGVGPMRIPPAHLGCYFFSRTRKGYTLHRSTRAASTIPPEVWQHAPGSSGSMSFHAKQEKPVWRMLVSVTVHVKEKTYRIVRYQHFKTAIQTHRERRRLLQKLLETAGEDDSTNWVWHKQKGGWKAIRWLNLGAFQCEMYNMGFWFVTDSQSKN